MKNCLWAKLSFESREYFLYSSSFIDFQFQISFCIESFIVNERPCQGTWKYLFQSFSKPDFPYVSMNEKFYLPAKKPFFAFSPKVVNEFVFNVNV